MKRFVIQFYIEIMLSVLLFEQTGWCGERGTEREKAAALEKVERVLRGDGDDASAVRLYVCSFAR